MTKEEAIKTLIDLQRNTNLEVAHIKADEVLTSFLETLGYSEIVVEYDKIGKWYA